MPRKFFLLVTVFGVLLGLAACSDDDDGEGNPTDPGTDGKPPTEMVGTWVYESVTVDGTAADLATVMDWTAGAVEARLHVQASSAFVYEEVNAMGGQLWADSGFVFIDGDEIDINVQFNNDGPTDEMLRMGFTLESGTFTLTDTDGASVVVFTLTMPP